MSTDTLMDNEEMERKARGAQKKNEKLHEVYNVTFQRQGVKGGEIKHQKRKNLTGLYREQTLCFKVNVCS